MVGRVRQPSRVEGGVCAVHQSGFRTFHTGRLQERRPAAMPLALVPRTWESGA